MNLAKRRPTSAGQGFLILPARTFRNYSHTPCDFGTGTACSCPLLIGKCRADDRARADESHSWQRRNGKSPDSHPLAAENSAILEVGDVRTPPTAVPCHQSFDLSAAGWRQAMQRNRGRNRNTRFGSRLSRLRLRIAHAPLALFHFTLGAGDFRAKFRGHFHLVFQIILKPLAQCLNVVTRQSLNGCFNFLKCAHGGTLTLF